MGLVKRIFKLNLFMMQLLGFYPPQRFKHLYKVYSYAVYVSLTIPVPTLAAVHLLVSENVDLAQISDSSFMMFQVGCFIWKLIPFIFNSDEIRKSIYMLELPIFNNYTKTQEIILENCMKVCKRNTWLFLSFCAFTWGIWAVAPFFGSDHQFPIEIWLPFNATSSRRIHVFTFTFITMGVGSGALSNGVIDPLVSGLACFGAYQLKILKDNLENLNEHAKKEFYINRELIFPEKYHLINKIIYNRIQACVDHHNAILDFIQCYENTYSSVAFTQFVASVIVVCVSCLQLIMVEPFTLPFFAMVSFLLTMLLEIFLYCYFGTSLYDESNSLTSAIYMGNWYEYDLKSKQALLVLMERSKKPVVVTAGKILDLSLATWTTIIRRAYSLLAVLKNYQ